ncbi:DUF4340 domain-containing protein [Butyrivibrio fibrisolvens]|uniref:DUF4340 domain-containing protein n=1 Tax=Butyrivibrio fibrisolvens TaxID=831 RepID=A0A317G4T1_BUTFI|nr:DUF4340 domain-containing protein [Butyrivibrio fibrisolvens]PWT28409.1 hypothetical protein CPT75_15430 [Butyrivibrio fibrisolvens]
MKKQKTQLIIILVVLAVMVASYFALSAHNKKVVEDEATDDYTLLTLDTTKISEIKVTKTTKTEVTNEADSAADGTSANDAGAEASNTEDTSSSAAAGDSADTTASEALTADAAATTDAVAEGTSTEGSSAEGSSAAEPVYEYSSEVAYDLVLENGTWYLASDKSLEVDQDSVASLISKVATVTSNKEIAGVTDFAQYGLDHPSLSIEITLNDGIKTTIYVGDYNSVSSLYYARIGDSANVYMITATLSTSFGVEGSSFEKVDSSASTVETSAGITDVDIDASAASSAAAAQSSQNASAEATEGDSTSASTDTTTESAVVAE